MKPALCTFFYCLLFSLLARCQDYKVLIKKGDSLLKVKKFDSSFHTFEEALEAVSKLNVSVPEETWLRIFVGAAKSAAAGANHDKADKYWNLAKERRGEKLPDKITALVRRGLNSVTISERFFGGTRPYYFQECNVSITTYLLWAEDKSVLVQKFDDCKNYEPLKFTNRTLYAIINGAQRLKLDSMRNVNNHGYHEPVF
jgi:hypothetical protein